MTEMADWVCEKCGKTLGNHEVYDLEMVLETPQDRPEGIFQGRTWHRVYCPGSPTA